jgi:hypothetical protein
MVKIVIGGGTSVSGQVGSFQNRVITDGGTFEAPGCLSEFLKSLGGEELIGGILDVRPDVNVPLTFSVGEIRDITKRTGTFSKTIVLPATDNNNRILNHYYDVNVEAGTFDLTKLTYCQVYQNDVLILEDAILQLVGVNKSQNTDQYEQVANYEVLIKDTKAELFTAITNAELTDIDFSDLNHYSNSSIIIATYSFTQGNGFKYVLPYSPTNVINVRQLKPAIYAKTYFDRIFANAGFSYTWADLQNARFDKLLIPYNGDENQIDWNDFKVEADATFNTAFAQPANGNFLGFQQQVIGFTEILDPQNIFNPLTGAYTAPTDTDPAASQGYEFRITINYDIIFNNFSASPVQPYVFDSLGGVYDPETITFTPILKALNAAGQGTTASLTPVTISNFIPSGVSVLTNYNNLVITSPTGYISTGDLLTIAAGVQSNWLFGFTTWRTALGAAARVDVNLKIKSLNVEITPNSNTQPIGGFVQMNEYVPQKVKQSDFVKSIFTMYNLFADVNPEQPNNIILTHRDEYYDNGAEKDWTYKLAKDREQNLEFLPDVTNKRLILTYKQDKDSANQLYFDTTREIYGQLEYIFNSEYVKDIDTKELIFGPTPITATTFGAIVPMIDGQAPKTNLRILYDGGAKFCGSYDLIDGGITGTYGVTTYPAITHFDNANTPSFDLNFGTCDFYYYDPQTLTNNNLYNLYWRRTINQINEGKMLTAFFRLTEADIHNLKLNDKIRIDNSWWNINRVIDYNANTDTLTKVELISVDTELELAPFITKPVKPLASVNTQAALNSILTSKMYSGNQILEGADVAVYGKSNSVAQGVKGIVIGENKTLNEDGIITPRINGITLQNSMYIANLNQRGANPPTAIELANTIGIVIWSRTAQGEYLGIPTTPLDPLTTYVMINQVEHDYQTSAFINTNGEIVVVTCRNSGHHHDDGILNNTTLEIRTY